MLGLSDSLQNYTGLTVLTILFFTSAAILVATSHTVRKRPQKMFFICFVALIFVVSADWFNNIFNGTHPEYRYAHIALTTAIFSIAPAISVLIVQTIVPSRAFKYIVGILIAHALFEFANLFFGYVFWVDETNSYYRGPLYGVYTAMYALSVLYLVFQSARASRVYQSKTVLPMAMVVIGLTIGVGAQILSSNIRTSWIAVGMAVVLYYLYYSDVLLRTDTLTRLLNRLSYNEAIDKPPLPCAIILLDIDNFKIANDTYGHAYGDSCLVTISGLIRRSFGSVGRCFRTGGDEFVVIARKNLDSVEQVIEDFKDAMKEAQMADPRIPGVSVGFARAEAGCTDIASVINKADSSMYGVKRSAKHSALAI